MFRRSSFCLISVTIVLCCNLSVQIGFAQTPDGTSDRKGLTFTTPAESATTVNGLFTAICGSADSDIEACNRYSGDTLCKLERPVLCYLDIDAPVPNEVEPAENWAGGVLALSSPVPGKRFGRISDANAYCAATFGDGWRVASYHDSGGGALKGYGVTPSERTRFWIDIKNQPDATCWAR